MADDVSRRIVERKFVCEIPQREKSGASVAMPMVRIVGYWRITADVVLAAADCGAGAIVACADVAEAVAVAASFPQLNKQFETRWKTWMYSSGSFLKTRNTNPCPGSGTCHRDIPPNSPCRFFCVRSMK